MKSTWLIFFTFLLVCFFTPSLFQCSARSIAPLSEEVEKMENVLQTEYIPPPCGHADKRKSKSDKNQKNHNGSRPKRLSLNQIRRRLKAIAEDPNVTTPRSPSTTMEMSPEHAITLFDFLDEQTLVEQFRKKRWENGVVICPRCGSHQVKIVNKRYKKYWCRYRCEICAMSDDRPTTFTDKTGTIFAGSRLPMKYWFAGITLFLDGKSAKYVSEELALNPKTGERMLKLLLTSGYFNREKSPLSGTVESDEVYIISGFKGNPAGTRLDRSPRKRGLKRRGRGTFDSDKVPVIALVQRHGETRLLTLKNVRSDTIKPYFKSLLEPGVTVFTDEYSIYNFLIKEGFKHESVNHSAGEYARGEVHCNTAEGLFSLLRQFLRNYRGVSKTYLPFYVAAFEFKHNHREMSKWEMSLEFLSLVLTADGQKIRTAYRNCSLAQFCRYDRQIDHFT